jgi:predicted GIY-YIG superfamily endonuclease
MVAMRARRRRRAPAAGVVYLIHFGKRYHHAGHYVGFTDDVDRRMSEHRTGAGSRLLAAVAAAGVPFAVAFTWLRASRAFERKVHRYKKTPRLCPICTGSDRRARNYTPRDPDARLAAPVETGT